MMRASSLGLVGLLALSLAACGSSGKTTNDGGKDAPTDGPTGTDTPVDMAPDESTSDAVDAPPTEVAPDAGVDAAPDVALDAPATTDASDAAMDAVDAGPHDAGADVVPTPAPDYIWYVLDETSGTTAKDSSSHHYDITNLTGVTWNGGANFDGVSGGGSTTVGASYRQPPITISAWLKPVTRSDGNQVRYSLQPFPPNAISDDVPGVGGYGLGLNVWSDAPAGSALAAEGLDDCASAGLCVARLAQNAASADAGAPSCTSASSCSQGFTGGTEYFVVYTVGAPPQGGGDPVARVYVNGVVFDSGTAYVPAANANPPLFLGRHNDDTAYGATRVFDGRIRDVRVYQRELAADEVKQLFTNGPTTKAPTSTTDGGATD
ncbi:MAG TPA: LamG-like jellyroll fold domain-containing protein [Polyangia bacterium]|nr:LamG-like jellyroll fold domain-containing protein [Polyangia bacterium]